MKKLIAVITALLLMLTSISAAALTVSVPPALGMAGDTLRVSLRIDGNTFVSAASLQIEYDSEKLGYLSYEKGEKLNAEYCHVAVLDKGKLQISFTDGTHDFVGDGVIVYLSFNVANSAEGTVDIRPLTTEGGLFDHSYIEIEYSVSAGEIYILPRSLTGAIEVKGEFIYLNRCFAVAELAQRLGDDFILKQTYGFVGSGQTITYKGNSFYTVCRGDVNGDALVNTADYMALRAYLCNAASLSNAFAIAADINGDEVNSSADLLSLRGLLATPVKT